jgi:hypothetical protein
LYIKKTKSKLFKFAFSKKRRRKKVKEDPNLVANGRFQCSMGFGRFQAWWPMEGSNVRWALEGSKLGGQWKVPMFSGF